MAAKIYIKKDGTWQTITSVYVKDSGAWQNIDKVYAKDGGVWRLVFNNSHEFTKTFTAPESAWDFYPALTTPTPTYTGWNTPTVPSATPVTATITVNPGVYVYSSTAGAPGYGMRIDSPVAMPSDSTISLIINGDIVGRAGNGGTGGTSTATHNDNFPGPKAATWSPRVTNDGNVGSAGSPALILGPFNAPSPTDVQVTITAGGPTNRIRSGGGGGGGGGGAYALYAGPGSAGGGALSGGGGGGGGGRGVTGPNPTRGTGGSGGPASSSIPSPSLAPYITNDPGPGGSTGNSSAGSGGPINPTVESHTAAIPTGPVTCTSRGGAGGAGGAAGNDGSSGNVGSPAPAVTGPAPALSGLTQYEGTPARSPGSSGGPAGNSIRGTDYIAPGSSYFTDGPTNATP